MSGKISVKDKQAVESGIKDCDAQKDRITAAGSSLQTEYEALTAAFGITIDGEGASGDAPTGLGSAAKAEADTAAAKLGALADGWRGWVSGLEVIQEQGATDVQGRGASNPESKTEKPGDKPVGETPTPDNVWVQRVPEEPKPPHPLTPDPSVPPAFAMK